jgi:signal transduction histidine kinase
MTGEETVRVRLRPYLGRRLRPLVAVVAIIVAITAPTALYVLGVRSLQVQAQVAAQQVGEVIRSDVERRPQLWKYDAVKVIAHVRSYELQQDIARVEVVDDRDVPIDPASREALAKLDQSELVWQVSDVMANNAVVARVWVAMSTRALRRQSWLLLGGFTGLAVLLAGLMYWLPMRSVARAESEIDALVGRLSASRSELAALNAGLERQVEARSAALATALAEVQEKEHRLREISSSAVELQEQQRGAIARDLHDSAGQTLTAIRINLQLVGRMLDSAKPEELDRLRELATRTTRLVDETVEELRRAVRLLGPAVIEDVGLARSLQRLCEDVEQQGGMVVEHQIALPEAGLPRAVTTTCYRVVQEALTNVVKHARAGQVVVKVSCADERLMIRVDDDGVGLGNAPAHAPTRGRGLAGMRERVELLGGELEVVSEPDGGTRLAAVLPVKQA